MSQWKLCLPTQEARYLIGEIKKSEAIRLELKKKKLTSQVHPNAASENTESLNSRSIKLYPMPHISARRFQSLACPEPKAS